jgi:hypothetical protein
LSNIYEYSEEDDSIAVVLKNLLNAESVRIWNNVDKKSELEGFVT